MALDFKLPFKKYVIELIIGIYAAIYVFIDFSHNIKLWVGNLSQYWSNIVASILIFIMGISVCISSMKKWKDIEELEVERIKLENKNLELQNEKLQFEINELKKSKK